MRYSKKSIKWQGWRDSNPQPSVLETAVLPIRTTPLNIRAITRLFISYTTLVSWRVLKGIVRVIREGCVLYLCLSMIQEKYNIIDLAPVATASQHR